MLILIKIWTTACVIPTGYIVHDYADMQFEEFDDDPPMFNIKHPKTTTGAAKKVCKDVIKLL